MSECRNTHEVMLQYVRQLLSSIAVVKGGVFELTTQTNMHKKVVCYTVPPSIKILKNNHILSI